MAPKTDTSERSCAVSRAAQPPEGLIRFALGPDGRVAPDLKGRLPGRGVWVTARRDMVAEAVRRKLFARGFKAEAQADPGLPDLVGRLMREDCLSALSMARKAGQVVTGFGQVGDAIAGGHVLAVVHAAEAAEDGRRKVGQLLRRRQRAELDLQPGEPLEPAAFGQQEAAFAPAVIEGIFASRELDLAIGGANVIHAALLAGGASASFLKCAARLVRYGDGPPDTDWTARP